MRRGLHVNKATNWIFIAVLLSACAIRSEIQLSTPSPTKLTVNSPQPSSSWELEFNLSGGFQGYQRISNLLNTGKLTVVDENNDQQVSVQLDQEEMDKINLFLVNIEKLRFDLQPPYCADCMVYELNLQRDGINLHAILNDLNLNESTLKPLIIELMQLQEQALKS